MPSTMRRWKRCRRRWPASTLTRTPMSRSCTGRGAPSHRGGRAAPATAAARGAGAVRRPQGRGADSGRLFTHAVNWKPVVAAVHGYVMGLAVGIALDCDLLVAEAGTRFQITETSRGLGGSSIGADAAARRGRLRRRGGADRTLVHRRRGRRGRRRHRLAPAAAISKPPAGLAETLNANPPLSVRSTVRARRREIARVRSELSAAAAAGTALSDRGFHEAALAFKGEAPAPPVQGPLSGSSPSITGRKPTRMCFSPAGRLWRAAGRQTPQPLSSQDPPLTRKRPGRPRSRSTRRPGRRRPAGRMARRPRETGPRAACRTAPPSWLLRRPAHSRRPREPAPVRAARGLLPFGARSAAARRARCARKATPYRPRVLMRDQHDRVLRRPSGARPPAQAWRACGGDRGDQAVALPGSASTSGALWARFGDEGRILRIGDGRAGDPEARQAQRPAVALAVIPALSAGDRMAVGGLVQPVGGFPALPRRNRR